MIFSIDGVIVYYIWTSYIILYICKLLLHLPFTSKAIFSFITNIVFILLIGGVISYCLDFLIVNKECHYQVDMNETSTPSSNTNLKDTGGNNNNPEPPKDEIFKGKNHNNSDETEDGDRYKDKDIPKSVSTNSITKSVSTNSINSDISYNSDDIALAAKLDKKNFENVISSDVNKAKELYDQKADELAKIKTELAKFKKSSKVTVGLKIVEEEPF